MEAVIDEVLDAPDSDDQEEHEDRMTNNLRFDNVLKLERAIVKNDDSMERGDFQVSTKIDTSGRNLNTIQSKKKNFHENKQDGGNEEIKDNQKSEETKHRSFKGSKYPNILSKNKQQQINEGRVTTLILPKVTKIRRNAVRTRMKIPKDRPKGKRRFGNKDKKSGIAIGFSKTEQTTMNFFATDCSGRHKKRISMNFQIPKQ